jgi:hypothetical protein
MTMFTLDRIVAGVSMQDAIAYRRSELEKSAAACEARVRRIFAAAELLEEAGFVTYVSKYSSYILTLRVDRSRLPELRKALGPMKVHGKQVENASKRTIIVTLTFPDHPEVYIEYEKTLPRAPKGAEPRCKIVRRTSVHHDLVCQL